MSLQPLKLFHLPTLVLRNVLQLLNPIELFELSQCSRRALSIIPLSGSRNFKLQIDQFSSSIHVNGHIFRIYSTRAQSIYIPHGTRTFMESTVKIYHRIEHELASFWDNKLVGLRTVFFHVSKVFNCPTECARFFYAIPAVIYMSFIDFISSRQSEIKELTIWGDGLTDKHVTEIFDKLRVTDHLEMSHRFSRAPSIPLNLESIVIWNSAWITTQHLNSMNNCRVIHLDQSTFTDSNMTSFLNDWKSGQYPNLQYLSINSDFLSERFTAFGLPSLRVTVNSQMYERTILGYSRFIYGGVDVQRDDGVAAKIYYDNNGELKILLL
ncbi:hypothetical protein GCK72_011380 [Caenorhabditis remanei]|uniref:F-box domain-containing protein n=1 Tax=Caenorhabditis remanei TaxID=31234 RepID=A0A6A5H8J5_CAERE|nr:hypothetical protein GCK72_011380 [Caenorhabditis remanei]KAF1763114.1 hypothetical protein GCK72_011380 [Caenorhabditis remanei]